MTDEPGQDVLPMEFDGVFDRWRYRAITRHMRCSTGVLDSIAWTLNELADNVLVHAAEPDGEAEGFGAGHERLPDLAYQRRDRHQRGTVGIAAIAGV